jgi:hypothetical protein
MLHQGVNGAYYWLTSSEHYITNLIATNPDIVLGRYGAMTCQDGGAVRLTARQQAAGWTLRGGIAYSPLLQSTADLEFQVDGKDAPGYDELYVFGSPTDMGDRIQGDIFTNFGTTSQVRTAVFVTFGSFRLYDTSAADQDLCALFWRQLHGFKPESYVADGTDCLTFVTRRKELFQTVYDSFASTATT